MGLASAKLLLDNPRLDSLGAVVLGDEVLLGAVPMEDLDLVVIPAERRVVANPLNPNFAAGVAKGFMGVED